MNVEFDIHFLEGVSIKYTEESIDDFIENYKGDYLPDGQPLNKIAKRNDGYLNQISVTYMQGTNAMGMDRDYVYININDNDRNIIISYHDYNELHKKVINSFNFLK